MVLSLAPSLHGPGSMQVCGCTRVCSLFFCAVDMTDVVQSSLPPMAGDHHAEPLTSDERHFGPGTLAY